MLNAFALLAVLALGAQETPGNPILPDPGPLFAPCWHDPYYRGKHGFRTAAMARDHAYKEFRREARAGRIDPSDREYFTYIFEWVPGNPAGRIFLHTPWVPAEDAGRSGSHHFFRASCPLHPKEELRVFTMMHSHPTRGVGAGPSWADLATASQYRNPDGSYRYLYLVNNRGRLMSFKAKRYLDAAHAAGRPGMPRRFHDYLD